MWGVVLTGCLLILEVTAADLLYRSGRRACSSGGHAGVVSVTQSYVQPVHKPVITVCEGHRVCSTYRTTYKISYRQTAKKTWLPLYTCCPGWRRMNGHSCDNGTRSPALYGGESAGNPAHHLYGDHISCCTDLSHRAERRPVCCRLSACSWVCIFAAGHEGPRCVPMCHGQLDSDPRKWLQSVSIIKVFDVELRRVDDYSVESAVKPLSIRPGREGAELAAASQGVSCRLLCQNGGTCVGYNKCQCSEGWSGHLCQTDVDECESGQHRCAQSCTNTGGSFLCGCREGFSLSSDGKSCHKVEKVTAAPLTSPQSSANGTAETEAMRQEMQELRRKMEVLEQKLQLVLAPFDSLATVAPEDGLGPVTLLTHSFQQLDRIDSLSEQISFLEERLETCSCKNDL